MPSTSFIWSASKLVFRLKMPLGHFNRLNFSKIESSPLGLKFRLVWIKGLQPVDQVIAGSRVLVEHIRIKMPWLVVILVADFDGAPFTNRILNQAMAVIADR